MKTPEKDLNALKRKVGLKKKDLKPGDLMTAYNKMNKNGISLHKELAMKGLKK